MNILIKNCTLISMSEARERLEKNIDILIKDKKINKIGVNLTTELDTKVINAQDLICLPGLINSHAHIPMSIFRETLDGYTLQDWLNNKIWPMEDKLTPEDIYYASILSFIEMISTGTVLVNDQYYMSDETIRAALDIGARVQLTRTINDVANLQEKRLTELKDFIEKYNNKYDNITLNVGIHGLYTTGADTLKKCIEIAKNKNLPIHMHFCENEQETIDIKNNFNVNSPIDVLKQYFSDLHLILAHSVKVSDEEIKELSKMNVHIAHCPISNLRLGSGIAPIQKMLDNGINVSLGTDGQGSGSNLDLFDTMKFSALLQKTDNVTNMDAYEVLKMATINGAKALALDNKIGSIDEGKDADIILVDLNTEVCQPYGNIFSNLVYNCKGTNVQSTIINGSIVMDNRNIVGIDKQKIFDECSKIIDRIQR